MKQKENEYIWNVLTERMEGDGLGHADQERNFVFILSAVKIDWRVLSKQKNDAICSWKSSGCWLENRLKDGKRAVWRPLQESQVTDADSWTGGGVRLEEREWAWDVCRSRFTRLGGGLIEDRGDLETSSEACLKSALNSFPLLLCLMEISPFQS